MGKKRVQRPQASKRQREFGEAVRQPSRPRPVEDDRRPKYGSWADYQA